MKRCRHERNSWLIAGGFVEWCFACGAWRRLRRVTGEVNAFAAAGPWNKPSGDPDLNPFDDHQAQERWEARLARRREKGDPHSLRSLTY